MGFESRHTERDKRLHQFREEILARALEDLSSDRHVVAIYLAGSLGKGNFDQYSDIDLHIIVAPEMKKDFIIDKRKRSAKWGNVLFFEEVSPATPVVVTHYDCFIKVDSWYKTLDEVIPSIWLKGLEPLYDPKNVLAPLLLEASKCVFKVEAEDVTFWRDKVLAFLHETYRSVMRSEMYYALSNLDRVRWLIADGWYMEMENHLDSSYGVWSKIEGNRSQLQQWQLSLLASWSCGRDANDIIKTMTNMYPELVRLNTVLFKKTGMDVEEDKFKRIIEMIL